MITTGSTREYIDPVRYISNKSSGKQGYEIALALSKIGIKTSLIVANSDLKPSKELKIIKVETANQMFEAVKNLLPVDIAICAAELLSTPHLRTHYAGKAFELTGSMPVSAHEIAEIFANHS